MKNRTALKTAATLLTAATLSVGLAAPALASENTAAALILSDTQDAKAVEIIEASIEALGGAEKLKGIKHVTQKGTISIPMAGLTGSVTSYVSSPDSFLMVVSLPSMGETRSGLTDGVAWSSDAMQGPRVMPEDEARQVEREADMQTRLRFKQMYPTITYAGETEFDGQQAHKIELVDTHGDKSTQYYSVKQKHQIGSETVASSPMGPTNTITYLRDYKDLGGVTQPTKVVQKIGAAEVIITISSAEYEPIEESVYELPAAVKALVEASEDKQDQSDTP